jgi:cobalt-zinc-cadmium efflux system outer membrane protein
VGLRKAGEMMSLGKRGRLLLVATLVALASWSLQGVTASAQAPAMLLPPQSEEPRVRTDNPAVGALSLSDLERMALTTNPTIAAAEALVEEERGLMQQVGLYPNPSFGYIRSDPSAPGRGPGQSETQGVFFSQELVVPGKRQLNRAIEGQDVRWRLWQLNAQRERVLNDVRIQFFEILGAQRAVEAAQELEKLAAEAVKIADTAFKAKSAARADVVRAEIQLQAIRIALQDAQLRHQSAWKQLAYLLGRPELQATALIGNLEEDVLQLDWEESLRALLANSPVLRAQEAKVREARYSWQRARLEAVPNLTVQVVAEHDQVQKSNTVSTLLALPVPIFNRNQGNVYNAAAAITHQQKERERLELALYHQFAASFRTYQVARNHAERIKKEILPRVKENLDLTNQAQKAGKFSIFPLLEARQLYFETDHAYIDALTEVHKTGIEIKGMLLTGGLNPTEIGTALQTTPGTAGAGMRNLLLQQLQEQGAGKNRLLPGAVQGAER